MMSIQFEEIITWKTCTHLAYQIDIVCCGLSGAGFWPRFFFLLFFMLFVHTFYFVNSKLISFAFRLYIIIYCNSTLNHSLSETISSLFTYSIKFQCKWLTLPLLIAARMVNSAFVWPTFICLLEHGVAIFCYILFVKWLWNGFRWITTTATNEEKKNKMYSDCERSV